MVILTPYQNIYTRFLSKVTDYDFLKIENEDLEEILLGYLKSAIPKFTQSKTNLNLRDDNLKQFTSTLSDFEEEILANIMLLEWIAPKINHSNLMEQQLSTKDFQLYSQANHIKELREQKNAIEDDIDRLISTYSYNYDLVDLS